mmetsp:Transcript_19571/g.60348  ORF Transcript_19571/g.60348 Transcript_19571/m.60348 type:complete len:764 (+) Transcript_19571:694-2985(+)
MMSQACLPAHVDFGCCALLAKVIKSVEIECTVPIAYEYHIVLLETNPQFEILAPLSGKITAKSSLQLRIQFHPVTLGTSSVRILVETSQLDSKPYLLNVLGNAVPGKRRQRILDSGTCSALHDPRKLSVDYPTNLLIQRRITQRGANLSHERASVLGEYFMEGLKIPTRLRNGDQRSTNYILTQCTGKLKPKDLKQAIVNQRERRAEQERDQAILRELMGDDSNTAVELSVHAICAEVAAPLRELNSNEQNARQLKEMALLQDLTDTGTLEKEREFKGSEEFFGERLLTSEECEVICTQVTGIALKLGNKHRSDQRSKTSIGMPAPTDACVVRPTVDQETILEPKFDVLAENAWDKRTTTLQLTIARIGTWIIRRRAMKRLRTVKIRLVCSKTREEVQALVSLDHIQALLVAGGGVDKDQHHEQKRNFQYVGGNEIDDMQTVKSLLPQMSQPDTLIINSNTLSSSFFPRYQENAAVTRKAIYTRVPGLDKGIAAIGMQHSDVLVVALCYKAVIPPQFCCHFQIIIGLGLRGGAFEESGVSATPPHTCMDFVDRSGPFSEMPQVLQKSLSVDSWASLGCTKSDVTAHQFPGVDEASIAWSLRPGRVLRKPNLTMKIVTGRHAVTANAYPASLATTSDYWRPRMGQRACGVSCLSEQQALCPWPVESTIPQPDNAPSDSESEDENIASHLFRQPVNKRLGDYDDNKNKSSPVVSDTPRDRAHLEMARVNHCERTAAAATLDKQLCGIALYIRQPVHEEFLNKDAP